MECDPRRDSGGVVNLITVLFLCSCVLPDLLILSLPLPSSLHRRPYGSHSMRHFLHRGGHGAGGGPVLRRWSQPVNAGEVPNELIEQAAAVLQGKSRDVIIRELQRTVSADPAICPVTTTATMPSSAHMDIPTYAPTGAVCSICSVCTALHLGNVLLHVP